MPDTVEFINVSKDDALAYPNKVHREYPSTVNARMENTIRPFIQKSLEVNNTFIDIFNDKLGLPKGALAQRHKMFEPSGSESRCIKNPPRSGASADNNSKTAIGAHTDFGSLVRSPTYALSFVISRFGLDSVVLAQSPRRPTSHAPWFRDVALHSGKRLYVTKRVFSHGHGCSPCPATLFVISETRCPSSVEVSYALICIVWCAFRPAFLAT